MITTKKHRIRRPKIATTGKVVFIISLFMLISAMLGGMIFWYGNIFDGIRAYVRGEGLWAKAQMNAVFYLESYSYSQSETDFNAYRNALLVIKGDHEARLALLKSPPNQDEARIGFLQGQNHPDDINALIGFFLTFQQISYMRDAIATWEIGDQTIAELEQTGQQIQAAIVASGRETETLDGLRKRVHHLNDELHHLENRFSAVLGEGARWVKQITWQLTALTLILSTGIALLVSRQIVNGIVKSEQQLLASESRFRRLKESNTIGIISWRMDGTVEEANDLFLAMLGYDRSHLSSGEINWRALTPAEYLHRDQQAIDELLTHGRCEPFEKALIHKQGHIVPILVGAAVISRDAEHGIAYVMDLSERKKAEQQLKLAATVFDGSSDGILVTDASIRIVSANRALCLMTGYEENELLGERPSILKSGYTSQDEYNQMWKTLIESGQWQGDMIDRTKSGGLIPLRASINRIKNADDEITHYVAILSDISERKAREEYLHHIAYHDPLTGLPNRMLLHDRLDRAIELAASKRSKFGLLFLDLDKFKPVNDLLGHEVGDTLLQSVAQRLARCIRASDTVTRLGGDEFVVLLDDVTTQEAVQTTLNHVMAAICKPYRIAGHTIEIGVSAGMSLYPDHGLDAKNLLHHADKAMYIAKETKSNGVACHESDSG